LYNKICLDNQFEEVGLPMDVEMRQPLY